MFGFRRRNYKAECMLLTAAAELACVVLKATNANTDKLIAERDELKGLVAGQEGRATAQYELIDTQRTTIAAQTSQIDQLKAKIETLTRDIG